MTRLEDCDTRCHVWGCRTTVCLDDDPAALCDLCGLVTCDRCNHECEAAVTNLRCQKCDRQLREGESAWADDWTVIEADGARTEVRYTCDDCEAAA